MRTPTRKNRELASPPNAPPPNAWPAGDWPADDGEPREEAARESGAAPERLPMVAIVGRPNVGKSTLFNRILGRRKALVHERPGATRDRNIEPAEWEGVRFLCVDTGGFDSRLDDPLLASVVEQVRLAIDDADVLILLLAAGEPDHPADAEIIRLLRGADKPILVAVNKSDNPALALEANEFYRHGFGEIFPITALHGSGVGDLLSAVAGALRRLDHAPRHAHGGGGIALAIVGRQNVGKSTLVNRLAGAERVIAAPLPGTTRDAIDTVVTTSEGRIFTLIDTAGIRRRGKVEVGIEKLSVLSSMMSLRRADVAAIVIDATVGITDQDAHIAGYCLDSGLAAMILVNKWDLVEKDHRTADQFTHRLEEEWRFMTWAPVLYLSALTGQRAVRVFEVAERVYGNARRRVATHELNARLTEWVGGRPPAMKFNRRPKVRFLAQTGVLPPTFTLFVNDPALFHFSYRRYIVNRLREAYDFEGTPIRLQLRKNKTREGDPEVKVE
ncbi:MAG: ribosome biogenesis GTPase Der [bacterium]|nr:ribosome biogenesis GTPase Der [bacterium]